MHFAALQFVDFLEPRRLLSAGQLDPTYGAGGAVRIPAANYSEISAIHSTPGGGALVLIRYSFANELQLMRLTPAGAFDYSFGGFGALTFPLDTIGAGGVTVDPSDGRIAVVQSTLQVSLFTADGISDPTFSSDGVLSIKTTLALSQTTFGAVARFTPDGSLDIALESQGDEASSGLVLTRLTRAGDVDDSFGAGGKTVVETAIEAVRGLVVNPDGSLLFAGQQFNEALDPDTGGAESTTALTLRSFSASGAPGNVNTFSTGIDIVADVLDLRRSGDGGIALLTKETVFDSDTDQIRFFIYRVSGDGLFRSRFDIGVNESDTPNRVDADAAGNLIVTGSKATGEPEARRFTVANTLDTSYGNGGVALSGLSDISATRATAIVQQPDGRVLFGTTRQHATSFGKNDFIFERLQGSPPPSPTIKLNRNGTLIITGTGEADVIRIYRRSRDGRVVARVNDIARSFKRHTIPHAAIYAGGGDDDVSVMSGVLYNYVDGGSGNDALRGGPGVDVLFGGEGNDYLLGGGSTDKLFGEDGDDTLSGGGGSDFLSGGLGGDRVIGGAGSDSAARDVLDSRDSIEMLLDIS